jgi:steroid delta-isomerase-like uncharacterized protein
MLIAVLSVPGVGMGEILPQLRRRGLLSRVVAMSIVRDFEMAFNRQDVTALVACFTPTGRYRDTFFGEHIGHAALRAMFERMFHEGRDYAWTMERVVEDDRRAAAEWTFSYVVSHAVPRSAGRKVRFPGMSIFELAGGKIAAYREYFDEGVALLQLGFAPESLAKILRRKLAGS